MKTNIILRAIAVGAFLVACAGIASARSAHLLDLGRQNLVIADSKAPSVASVRKAIIYGGSSHGWHPVGDKPGLVTLETDARGHRVVVDVVYDEKSFQISYRDSTNMDYEHSGATATIHPKYNQWVETLSNSIRDAALMASPHAK